MGAFDTNAKCVSRHTAYIYDRGATIRLGAVLDLSSVQWGRNKDAKSSATVALSSKKACAAQADFLKSIEPKRHELVLYRGDERVWEGPIAYAGSTSLGFTIKANDVTDYLDNTALTVDWPAPPVGPTLMVDRIRQIIEYELTTNYTADTNDGPVYVIRWENLDPPINVLQYLDIGAGVTKTSSDTVAFQMTLGQHLGNLSQSIGVSYTVVGRRIVVWDGYLSQTRTLTEADFSGDFLVTKDGSGFATIAHVGAQQQTAGVPEIVGHAANDLSYYGPWETVATTQGQASGGGSGSGSGSGGSGSGSGSAASQSALNSQARRALYGLYPVPRSLNTGSGATLLLSTDLGINQLVPGVTMPVRAAHNVIDVQQPQILNDMTVTEDPTNEVITVNLTAAGAVEA